MSKLRYTIPLEKLASRQVKLWEQTANRLSKEEIGVLPCITISKELGSQGVELAHRIANRLQWQLFDRDLVETIAKEARVRTEMVELFDERTQADIHNWVLTLLDRYALGTDEYSKHLVTVITTLGQRGKAVVVGRGGNFILTKDQALRLKVTAPLNLRVACIMRDEQLNRKEAQKLIARRDHEREAFIRRYFHRSDDPTCYDLVLNMGSLTLDSAEEIAVRALVAKFPSVNVLASSP